MIGTIVVGFDGSRPSERALELAAELAGRFEARVALVRVLLRDKEPEELRRLSDVQHVTVPDEETLAKIDETLRGPVAVGAGEVPQTLSEDALKRIGEHLLEGARRYLETQGIAEVSRTLEDGDPARYIVEAAERENADLVVVGSRGLGALDETLLGSISHNVARLVACPCLLVK